MACTSDELTGPALGHSMLVPAVSRQCGTVYRDQETVQSSLAFIGAL